MLKAALFVIDRAQKQPRCPSNEELIKKLCSILHDGILLIRPEGKWMELGKIILSEVSQTKKDKHD